MLKLKKIQIKELNKKADFYNRFGWVKIENFFKKNEIKNIQNKINKFLRKSLKRYNGRNINFASNQRTVEDINSFHRMHDFDWIKKLANQKGLKKIIKKFLKSDPELRACEYFAKPKRKGLPAPIHQDNYYWNVANNKGLTM